MYFPVQFLFADRISEVIVAPKSASEMMLRSGLQVLSLLYVWKYVYHFEFPRSKTEADQVLLLNSTPTLTNSVKTALAILTNTHCLCVSYTLAARRHFYTLQLTVCTGYLMPSVDDDWSLSLSMTFQVLKAVYRELMLSCSVIIRAHSFPQAAKFRAGQWNLPFAAEFQHYCGIKRNLRNDRD